MKITAVTPFILHVPLTCSMIADSTHTSSHWGVVGAQIDTDIGWLSTPDDQLVAGAARMVEDGFTGIKIKVGSSAKRGALRLTMVRAA